MTCAPAVSSVLPRDLRGTVPSSDDLTDRYLAELDVTELAIQGVDYDNPRYDLSGLKPIEEIDVVYDYRFDRLETTERRLKGVDRRRVLARIFESLAADAGDSTGILLRTAWFVRMNMYCNAVQAMWPDRSFVFDPLILLHLSEYRCGCGARLALDILQAGTEWPGRVAALATHAVAEVHFDGSWHLVDPLYFPDGVHPLLDDGRVPSLLEVERQPELLDRLPIFSDPGSDVRFMPGGRRVFAHRIPRRFSCPYPSRAYFAQEGYVSHRMHYLRKATDRPDPDDRNYGWDNVRIEYPDHQAMLQGQNKWMPSIPRLIDIGFESIGDATRVSLSWEPSDDDDGDLLDYRVMVGSRSRGWNYPGYDGPAHLARFKSRSHPDPLTAYRGQLALPPHDLVDATTTETSFTFELAPCPAAFVSICARDVYGVSIGREQYYLDTEFALFP